MRHEVTGKYLTFSAEISRLAAELREIKSLLKGREDGKVTKSTSTTQLEERQSVRQGVSRDRPNFIEENKRNVCRTRSKRPDRKSSRKAAQYPEDTRRADGKKLPTVDEQNEEIGSPSEICKTSSDSINQKLVRNETENSTHRLLIPLLHSKLCCFSTGLQGGDHPFGRKLV